MNFEWSCWEHCKNHTKECHSYCCAIPHKYNGIIYHVCIHFETTDKKKNQTVREIIKEWLENNGYDGLYYDGECGCMLDDLAPCCGDEIMDCQAGYKTKCTNNGCDGACDWHISKNPIIVYGVK